MPIAGIVMAPPEGSPSISVDIPTRPALAVPGVTRRRAARRPVIELTAFVAILVLSPLGLRLVGRRDAGQEQPSYLPALEATRPRLGFLAEPIEQLRYLQPAYVFIGDSMLGTRIDAAHLSTLIDDQPVAVLAHPATGPAYWYLALKNNVVASGVKPKVVFVFFRDTQITDPMFRLTEEYRWAVDHVALNEEPILNAVVARHTQGPWFQLHGLVSRFYGADRAGQSLDRTIRELPARMVAGGGARRFVTDMNRLFNYENLRPVASADIEAGAGPIPDFDAVVGDSLLPEMIRLVQAGGLKLCLVRVQRRPLPDGRPPRQSPELRAYIRALERYVQAHGQVFRDDTGDPEMTLDMYEDGDHVARGARARYSEIFRRRVAFLFP
jgi:hypothetical protein